MTELTRRGFLAAATAAAISIVIPDAADAANPWLRVAKVSKFKLGQPRVVLLSKTSGAAGTPVTVFVTRISGKLRVFSFYSQCTHQYRPLKGEGKVLVCPTHGSKFDPKSGKPIFGPAKFSDSPNLKKFNTRINKGFIEIQIPADL